MKSIDSETLSLYELIVGLEIHIQLLTHSKAYSGEANEYGQFPNTQISAIALAHPGTLPRANKKVLEYAVKLGIACNCTITKCNYYDRKNYFYPDLPKGYQITQDKTPICMGGKIYFKDSSSGEEKYVRLIRIHMEEDSGKLLHLKGIHETLIDLNRAGIPLLELVTEPDIRSAEEAYALLHEIRKMVRYLEICDGNMEEGSLRCDVNISIRLKGENTLGSKVEVKNINSISNVRRAIIYEFERQVMFLKENKHIASETRAFDFQTGRTVPMRMKEELNDYHYFPDPDLPPVVVTDEYLNRIKLAMPKLPREIFKRFIENYSLSSYDAGVLAEEKYFALYFEELCLETDNYKAAANWMIGPIKSYLNKQARSITQFPLKPIQICQIIDLVDAKKIHFSLASSSLLKKLIQYPDCSAQEIAEKFNLIYSSEKESIHSLIHNLLTQYPEKATAYKQGKKGVLGFLMGEIMRITKRKVNPKEASDLLVKELEEN